MRERGMAAALACFDPDRNLIYQLAAGAPSVRTYRQAASLPPALALLEQGEGQGDPDAIAQATAILETDSQSVWLIAHELNPSARSWTAVNPNMTLAAVTPS